MVCKTINKEMRCWISDILALSDKVLKTDSDKAKTYRKTKILIIILLFVLMPLQGCCTIFTKLTPLGIEPPDFPLIQLKKYACYPELYDAIVTVSGGKIGHNPNARFTIRRINLRPNIGYTSSYSLYYDVYNAANESVFQGSLHDLVEVIGLCSEKPFDDEYRSLISNFINKDAANQLMNNLYKNMPAVVAIEREREKKALEEQRRKEEARQKAEEEQRLREEQRREEQSRREEQGRREEQSRREEQRRREEIERRARDKRQKEWAIMRDNAEEAIKNNKLYDAISILEDAIAKGLGGIEPQKLLSEIYQSPEWLEQRPKVCIQKFEISQNLDPALGGFLYETLMAELSVSPKRAIVDWEELYRLLKFIAKSEPHLSEEDAKRQAMNKLGVKHLYVGTYYKIGTKYYVTVKVLNFNLLVDASYQDSTDSEDGLKDCVKRIATRIIQSKLRQ